VFAYWKFLADENPEVIKGKKLAIDIRIDFNIIIFNIYSPFIL